MTQRVLLVLFASCLALGAWADDVAAVADAAKAGPDPEMEAEIAYVTALVDAGFPDLAQLVIDKTKKRWPESDAAFFAIEIRGLLTLNKFDEAEKKIASLPDRKSSKYWAARLELANSYSRRNRKKECAEIYDAFFKQFEKPPKELMSFYLNACYAWGQLLTMDHRYEEAAQVYERLLKQKLPPEQWCMMGCETAELYIRLAEGVGEGGGGEKKPDPKKAKELAAKRNGFLDAAGKIADQLLQHPDQAIYFGRAVAMKAHVELMRGKVGYAQELIEEYMPQLVELHEALMANDPDGRKGLRKFSPLPQCRYLLAEMLWKEAQTAYASKGKAKVKVKGKEELKKPEEIDEEVKAYLFGEKDKTSGKRNGQGAYNHALNVFLKYPESTWAAQAGELADQIENFAIEKYQAKIKKQVTPEMVAQVRQSQWREAGNKLLDGDLKGGIATYLELLGKYPESVDSVSAIEQVINGYLDLLAQNNDEVVRLELDAVEGYLAERFSGSADRQVMMAAGDAVGRAAAKEKERGQLARAAALQRAFFTNYRGHPRAPVIAAAEAAAYQKDGRYADALEIWKLIGEIYTNANCYAASFSQLSKCYGQLGDTENQIAAMKRYVEIEPNALRRLQAQISLAQTYQTEGFTLLKTVDDIADEAERERTLKAASAKIVRGIQQFQDFAKKTDELIADPATSAEDKAEYAKLREAAMFLVGECWSRMKKPEDKLAMFRERSATALEAYVAAYPDGQWTKIAYVKLGMIYTALGDMEKSKDALGRLSKNFPDSDEAKNAKPALAKSLIEMGMKKEGTEIYAEMLDTDGAYGARQFVNAGEALIEAKSWDLADRAFEKAIKTAGTNQLSTVARARIGQANALYRQKRYAEARESLDLFLGNDKMARMSNAADAWMLLAEVASEQGRTEQDAAMRAKHFGAAVGAIKKLRNYWKQKPQWEQDRIDLMSADVVIRRMKAEEAMGLKDEAAETRARAAAMLQTFRQSRGVSPENPVDRMSAGDLENLERCYATMIPLFSAMGADQADRVITFGGEYLELFPNGKARTEIVNCINGAKAEGVKK